MQETMEAPPTAPQLPADVWREVLLQRRGIEAVRLCQTSRQFRAICADRALWAEKLRRDYGVDWVDSPEPFEHYRVEAEYEHLEASFLQLGDDELAVVTAAIYMLPRAKLMSGDMSAREWTDMMESLTGTAELFPRAMGPRFGYSLGDDMFLFPLAFHRKIRVRFIAQVGLPLYRNDPDDAGFFHMQLLEEKPRISPRLAREFVGCPASDAAPEEPKTALSEVVDNFLKNFDKAKFVDVGVFVFGFVLPWVEESD